MANLIDPSKLEHHWYCHKGPVPNRREQWHTTGQNYFVSGEYVGKQLVQNSGLFLVTLWQQMEYRRVIGLRLRLQDDCKRCLEARCVYVSAFVPPNGEYGESKSPQSKLCLQLERFKVVKPAQKQRSLSWIKIWSIWSMWSMWSMICDDGENPLALWNGGHVSRAPRNLIQYLFEQNALGSFSQNSFQSQERLLETLPV